MAYSNAPNPFTFTAGGTTLQLDELSSFESRSQRRVARHVFLKRDAGREEDMGAEQRELRTRLQFIGDDAAKRFSDFQQAVADNPQGLLQHPVHGSYEAFCHGPDLNVAFVRSTNQVECNVLWTETDGTTPTTETPDAASAAQDLTGQEAASEQSTAGFMGEVALSLVSSPDAISGIQSSIGAVASGVEAPLDYMYTQLTSVHSLGAQAIGTIKTLMDQANTVGVDVSDLTAAASDLLGGSGDPGNFDTTLGQLVADCEAQIDSLVASAATPAGAADAVADVCGILDAAYTLADAIAAATPPVVNYTVPHDGNVVVIAAEIIAQANADLDASAFASTILGLNRITNPALVRAGTVLRVPSLS